MKKVLVAVDETEASRRASEFVQCFFAGDEVDISAVNVARVPTDLAPAVPYGAVTAWSWPATAAYDSPGLDEAMDREEQHARGIVARQAPSGAETDVVFGDPVEAISKAAEDHDVDLIVVGSSDKGFFERLFSGSVSQDLARHAPRPVLIVP